MTRIYLIRHAQAMGNKNNICQGSLDADLSDKGERQLKSLAERCKKYHFDAVYASPLIRAYKTAKAADLYHHLPIVRMDGLKEIDVGRWEGKNYNVIAEMYPEENKIWENSPWDFDPQGGESMRHVYERAWDTIMEIVKQNKDKSVCVATHACVVRNFMCSAKGLPIERLNEVQWCGNTGINIIDFDEKLKPHIVVEGDTSHLDGQMEPALS